ncbi:hypothetical protein VA596_41730 [Amycolatopsis sp., V23-08]|uniref:Uncharacterized protein n=1 Tax=Amycolatopsis heterodermiae TaxID=3110235 RepID=A0ABU5RIV7_9PSEU|nr:hypothetical protein [Amycolatopsis sp., V23-08]MEA5366108.1 hypothetical protein [Amycolatopsis sp., V23-08]
MAFAAGQKVRASELNKLLAHALRYETNVATNCTTSTDTDIPFGTLIAADTAYFSVSAANITILQAGWLEAESAVRMASGTTGYELKIKLNGGLVTGTNGGSTLQGNIATGFPVSANDIVKVSVLHTTGSTKALETGAGRQNHIALSWRPL